MSGNEPTTGKHEGWTGGRGEILAFWRSASSGLWCAVNEGPFGALNGYVRLPEGHPWIGQDYRELEVDVHGGLTFAGEHFDEGWWIGFDCAHAGDLIPAFHYNMKGSVFRDAAYVSAECERLAAQIVQS